MSLLSNFKTSSDGRVYNPNGFFVDWDGNTRKTDDLQLTCILRDGGTYIGVDVVDHLGYVVYECTYFYSLEDVANAGVTINLV